MSMEISFGNIAGNYRAFLVDIYGVLHHASGTYAGAVEAVNTLQEKGREVIFFSNTCDALPEEVTCQLNREGIRAEPSQVISSGMALKNVMSDLNLVGKPVISVGNADTAEYVKRAGAKLTANWREAQASILGFTLNTENRVPFNFALNLALQRNKPTILANTDLFVPTSLTEIGIASGSTGTLFEQLTGRTTIKVGKPFPYMYQLAFEKLAGIPKSQILAVGDSLDYDIQGAANAGIDSLLVLSGLQGLITPGSRLDRCMRERNLYPTYILPDLSF